MNEQTVFPTIQASEIKTAILGESLGVDPEPNTPPILNRRNKYGLLINQKYVYKENGEIDWKGMLDIKYLYLRPDLKIRSKLEVKYGKKFEEIKPIEDKVDDIDLVINLSGIRFLLNLYGYSSLHFTIHESNEHYASVNCTIYFMGNYLTQGREIRYSDNACAHLDNTAGFGQKYLVELASNRAMCRAVRGFLNISVVSSEEISGGTNGNSEPPEDATIILLRETMTQHGVTWEKLKKKLTEEKIENAELFSSISDLPKILRFDIIGRIKRKAEEKAAEEKAAEKK